MNKNKLFLIVALGFITTSFSQHHYFGIKAGYVQSTASAPNGTLLIGGDGGQGRDWFGFVDGIQLGVFANIDIGNDFLHLDIAPQYSSYGFEEMGEFNLNYLDLDLGFSNFNAEVYSGFVGGIGLTPSLLLSSEGFENTNDFDLKVYLQIGYRFTEQLVLHAQAKYGVIEVVPDSELSNFQLSLNLSYQIFKI